MKKITIAIDGHSSCGKSTMAKDLAREVGYIYVDTGAMYRSVTLYALRKGIFEADGSVNTKELEEEMPNIHISFQLAVGFVRRALVAQQQQMGKDKGVVMDGRDIGTVVFPDAELKVFVTASAEVRAQRRYDELIAKGMPADFDDILKNVQERDYIDSHREESPLRQAEDAILLDNSNMTIEEQKQWLLEQFKNATL